jgi:hypothetical protein
LDKEGKKSGILEKLQLRRVCRLGTCKFSPERNVKAGEFPFFYRKKAEGRHRSLGGTRDLHEED